MTYKEWVMSIIKKNIEDKGNVSSISFTEKEFYNIYSQYEDEIWDLLIREGKANQSSPYDILKQEMILLENAITFKRTIIFWGINAIMEDELGHIVNDPFKIS